MERGLLAPLSPNEERTLRRVAAGERRPALLTERHIRRLTQLGLVQQGVDEVRLTEIGRKRFTQLLDTPVLRDTGPKEEANTPLARFFERSLR